MSQFQNINPKSNRYKMNTNFEHEDDEVTILEDEPKKDLYQEVEILFDGRGQQVEGGEDVTGAHNNKHEARGRVKNAVYDTVRQDVGILEQHKRRIRVVKYHLGPVCSCMDCQESVYMCSACIKTIKECTSRLIEICKYYPED